MNSAWSIRLSLCAAMALGAACTVHQAETSGLTGPSELGLSFAVTATPDFITQNHRFLRARLVVFGGEVTAQNRRDADDQRAAGGGTTCLEDLSETVPSQRACRPVGGAG